MTTSRQNSGLKSSSSSSLDGCPSWRQKFRCGICLLAFVYFIKLSQTNVFSCLLGFVCVCVYAEEKESLHKCSNWLRCISIFQFIAASCTIVSSVTHVFGYFHSWKHHVGHSDIVWHLPGRYIPSATAMILFCCHNCTTMTSRSCTQSMRLPHLLQDMLQVA